jgi:murein DD-endopeptidase MepM/ murein hydrolase activator NlpD
VIYSASKSDYGNLIIIEHGQGLTTRYGHLSRFGVRSGQKVAKGEIIGYVGTTGRSTGPHLHYEVRLNDRPVNPRNYLPRG